MVIHRNGALRQAARGTALRTAARRISFDESLVFERIHQDSYRLNGCDSGAQRTAGPNRRDH
jgi:hypothetical protein